MNKIIPGMKLTITRLLAISDIREWQGTFPELPLNRDHLFFKVGLKDLSQAQLNALFRDAA